MRNLLYLWVEFNINSWHQLIFDFLISILKKMYLKLKINFKNSIIPLLAGSIGLSPFLSIKAETAPDVTWTKLLGTSTIDYGYGVATASDGSVYITGYT